MDNYFEKFDEGLARYGLNKYLNARFDGERIKRLERAVIQDTESLTVAVGDDEQAFFTERLENSQRALESISANVWIGFDAANYELIAGSFKLNKRIPPDSYFFECLFLVKGKKPDHSVFFQPARSKTGKAIASGIKVTVLLYAWVKANRKLPGCTPESEFTNIVKDMVGGSEFTVSAQLNKTHKIPKLKDKIKAFKSL